MAVKVHDAIFVGNGSDVYKFAGSILHCARDPWFSEATKHKPLLMISRNVFSIYYNEMALNMVDAQHPKYFSDEMINAGLDFITERLAEGDAVLVHCQEGISRSPSLTMLWLFEHGFLNDDFKNACVEFKELYPPWKPNHGIFEYVRRRCTNQSTSATSL